MSNVHQRCEICQEGFANLTRLQIHYLQDAKHPVCCGLGFVDIAARNRHISESGLHPRCTDPSCGRSFIDQQALAQHLNSNHGQVYSVGSSSSATLTAPSMTRVRCQYCDATFVHQSALDMHQRAKQHYGPHSDMDTVEFKCFACNQKFSNSEVLKSHLSISLHTNCPICKVGFFNLSDLTVHFRKSMMHPTCRECNYGFLDSSAESQHRQPYTKHSRCSKCNHSFPSVCARLQHQCTALPSPAASKVDSNNVEQASEMKETSKTMRRCGGCAACFSDHESFGRHLQCGGCQTRFNDHGSFDLHLKRDSYCITCGRAFPSTCAEIQHTCKGRRSRETVGREANSIEAKQSSQEQKHNDTHSKIAYSTTSMLDAPIPILPQLSTPLAPRDANAPRLVNPMVLNEYLKSFANENGHKFEDKKVEVRGQSKENIRVRNPLVTIHLTTPPKQIYQSLV